MEDEGPRPDQRAPLGKAGSHTTVVADPKYYHGWPANHGAWQWGDELLVGFLRGLYKRGGMHHISGRFEKLLARSLDGGDTWTITHPGVDFEGIGATTGAYFDLMEPDTIIRCCGRYDHGGDYCDEAGAFYVSTDRGHTWSKPYRFSGVESLLTENGQWECSTRTCTNQDLVLLTRRLTDQWGTDQTIICRHDGYDFKPMLIPTADDHRAACPSAARIGSTLIVAFRRKALYSGRPGWIDVVRVNLKDWSHSEPIMVSENGYHNGNPPALIEQNGILYCAFANRSEQEMQLHRSTDEGRSWHPYTVLRKGRNPDIGYPQLFKRNDGDLVCVYYWSDEDDPQRIEATRINL